MKRLNLIKTIGVVGTLGVSSAALGIGLTSCSIKTISYDFGTLHHDETMDVIISGDELTYNGEYTTILTTKDGKTPAGLPDGVDYYYDVSQKVGIYSQDTGKRTIIGIIFKSLPPTSNKQTVTAWATKDFSPMMSNYSQYSWTKIKIKATWNWTQPE